MKILKLFSGLKVEIVVVFCDDNFVYRDVISLSVLCVGKWNMQRIECKYLIFCTRFKWLACRAICYSKLLEMYKVMFGLLINVLEFGCQPF
ncbi:MAG: IS1 family transposase [Nitrososphaerota archaeon]|nr:IS1 family transposase [Nitrososphaerota archaeon]